MALLTLRRADYWTAPRLDILSELRRRNLDHVVALVALALDPASARAARRVSAEWGQMLSRAAEDAAAARWAKSYKSN